ncbi:MAG TPA: cupin domain-containing protein [Solirubrobacterales bacterium]
MRRKEQVMEPLDAQGKIGPQVGERADFPRLGNRFIVRSNDTGGRFALLEHTVPPRALAAPTHTHANEDEYSFVLSGEIGVLLGDQVLTAGPGELVAKPRGLPHAFWNSGEEEARLLELISPGAFEHYFVEMAPFLNAEGERDLERIGAIQAKYDLSMDIESIGPLTQEHGLQA